MSKTCRCEVFEVCPVCDPQTHARLSAKPAPVPRLEAGERLEQCEWALIDEDERGDLSTSCGKEFQTLDGEAPDFIKFCCYCGKPMVLAALRAEVKS